ncbi:hypothetical protein MNEG_11949, partial [Monoraphidium neglectum]
EGQPPLPHRGAAGRPLRVLCVPAKPQGPPLQVDAPHRGAHVGPPPAAGGAAGAQVVLAQQQVAVLAVHDGVPRRGAVPVRCAARLDLDLEAAAPDVPRRGGAGV